MCWIAAFLLAVIVMGAFEEAMKMKAKRCTWTLEENEYSDWWDTGCGEGFSFSADGPEENGFSYCTFCGGILELVVYENDDED